MKVLSCSVLLGLSLCTVLFHSCSDKKEKAAEELETSGYQSTPADFLRAAENGDIKALQLFVKQEMDLGAKDDNGWTALHLAARAEKQESIAFLLESGMKVDTPGLDGVTPLMLAAREGNTSMVRYLLKQGAKAELKDEKKRSALILAVEGGHRSSVEELAPYSRAQLDTALLYAASKGKYQVIDTLTSFGASVYVRHDGGMTPLMLAAHHGHVDTVKSLLDSGANQYAVNEHGWTAAQVAAAAGKDKIAMMLNQGPVADEMVITEQEEAEGVDWEAPAEVASTDVPEGGLPEGGLPEPETPTTTAKTPASGTDIAAADKPTTGDNNEMPWNRPTGPEGGGALGLIPPKTTKHLPFVAGKTIASKGEAPATVTKDIAMVDYKEKPLPLMVEKTSPASSQGGSKAEVRMLFGNQKKVEVREGEVIPNTRFKIVNIRRILNHSKITDGQPTDVSVVEIEDTRTGKRRKMTARIPATASEPWAVIRTKSSGEYYAVRAGQSFNTADGQHFTVTDVRPSQLVITHNGTGEVNTIPLGR